VASTFKINDLAKSSGPLMSVERLIIVC
jgi:hypothetical protein